MIYSKRNKRRKEFERKLKNNFRHYFEGFYCCVIDEVEEIVAPIHKMDLRKLGISDIRFYYEPSGTQSRSVHVTFVLDRPGILVGKGGVLIDKVNSHLNDLMKSDLREVSMSRIKLNVKQCRIWE